MIFDDDDYLSVRNGTPQGKATENRMLDAMGGQDTIKKRFQTNADGSVVMAHTRGPGTQPEFITSLTASIPVEATAYMESGQLEWTYPAPLSPTRLDPASWHFLDIFTTQDYEGEISYAHSTLGQQLNVPSLAEGQASIAVDGTETSVLKKIVMGLYPASLFSGKMRSFIQAQYGAKDTPGNFKLTVELSGSSAILQYVNGGTITFGIWAHNTPGIFAASDGSWWLLSITGGPNYVVTAYRLVPNSVARSLINEYKISGLTDDVKAKLECYIFAHCTIDTSNPQSIGSFAGANGSAMAYGWKWKPDSSRASIVVHETLGTGNHDLRWKSSTMHIDFTYTPGPEPSASAFSITPTIVSGGEWTDGWGVYNIFVPIDENVGGPVELFSLATNRNGVKPAFSFSGVPVYAHYTGDTWEPVVLSRTIIPASSTPIITSSNLRWLPADAAGKDINTSYNATNDSYFYKKLTPTGGGMFMSISSGGYGYTGESRSGTYYSVEGTSGNIPSPTFTLNANYVADYITGEPELAPGEQAYIDTGYLKDDQGRGPYPEYAVFVEVTHSTGYTVNSINGYGEVNKAWALIIPNCDCSTFFVAKSEYIRLESSTTEYEQVGNNPRTVQHVYGWPSLPSFQFVTTILSWNHPPIYVDQGVTTINLTGAINRASTDYTVDWANGVDGVLPGVPGGSYYALFNVDYTYPYYDRGMYSYTSRDGRYVMSEGLKTPASVDAGHRFVGWA